MHAQITHILVHNDVFVTFKCLFLIAITLIHINHIVIIRNLIQVVDIYHVLVLGTWANQVQFVIEVAVEDNTYADSNVDKYSGAKKGILHGFWALTWSNSSMINFLFSLQYYKMYSFLCICFVNICVNIYQSHWYKCILSNVYASSIFSHFP